MENKIQQKNVTHNLKEASQLMEKIFNDMRTLCQLFGDPAIKEIKETGTFANLYGDGSVVDFIKNLELSIQMAKIEAEEWDKIKNMSPQIRSIYFMMQACQSLDEDRFCREDAIIPD